MKALLVSSLLFVVQTMYSQNLTDFATSEVEWSEGSIILNNNQELKGLVRYNDKNGILSYQNGNDSRSFTPRNVRAFEYFDFTQNKQRIYYALVLANEDTPRPYFFEVIKDYGDFALLSKLDPITLKKQKTTAGKILDGNNSTAVDSRGNRTTNPNPGNVFGETTRVYQVERIYLFQIEKGLIQPITEITNEAIEKPLGNSKIKEKDTLVGRSALEEFMSDKFKILSNYAKENKLNFDKKDQLITLFDYYVKNLKN